MVTIRLSRGGSKKRPFYSILVADQRRPLRGRFIERIGFYNPIARGQEEKFRIDTERVEHWLSLGAQPSERFSHLYKQMQNDGEVKSNTRVKNTKSVKRAKGGDEKGDDAAEAVTTEEAKSDDGAEVAKAEEAKGDDAAEAVKAEEAKSDDAAADAKAEETKSDDAAEPVKAEETKSDDAAESAEKSDTPDTSDNADGETTEAAEKES